MQSELLRRLGALVRDVAAREIMPRFQALSAADVMQKPSVEDPTDLVTAADRAAEAVLSERLPELCPGSTVVGEEAVAADPSLLDRLRDDTPVWLVDPLDGTRNFAAGHGPFGVMVALVERGEPLCAAIYLPERDQLLSAERGLGAFLEAEPLVSGDLLEERARLRGTPYARFLSEAQRAELERACAQHEILPAVTCAAYEYAEIALARKDYVVYYRLLPWDHAPGALIVREAGGVARHPNGSEYSVHDRAGLTLVTPSLERWQRAQRELFGG